MTTRFGTRPTRSLEPKSIRGSAKRSPLLLHRVVSTGRVTVAEQGFLGTELQTAEVHFLQLKTRGSDLLVAQTPQENGDKEHVAAGYTNT